MSLVDDYTADLAALRAARIEILTGTSIKEVWRDGRRIVYNVASVADLDRAIAEYIALLADAVAAADSSVPRRIRALSVRF